MTLTHFRPELENPNHKKHSTQLPCVMRKTFS